MGDHEGTTEQLATRQRPRTEYGYLVLGSVGFTAAVLLMIVDIVHVLELSRGLYAILVGAAVVGGCGWIVRSSDTHRRRMVAAGAAELCKGQAVLKAGLAELTSQVADLAGQVEQLRRAVARPGRVVGMCAPPGKTYASATAARLEDTVPLLPKVDEEVRRRSGGRSPYWDVYSDVLEDLAGIDGPPPPEP